MADKNTAPANMSMNSMYPIRIRGLGLILLMQKPPRNTPITMAIMVTEPKKYISL